MCQTPKIYGCHGDTKKMSFKMLTVWGKWSWPHPRAGELQNLSVWLTGSIHKCVFYVSLYFIFLLYERGEKKGFGDEDYSRDLWNLRMNGKMFPTAIERLFPKSICQDREQFYDHCCYSRANIVLLFMTLSMSHCVERWLANGEPSWNHHAYTDYITDW